MALGIGREGVVAPVGKRGAELVLRPPHPVHARELGMAAGQHHLGLVIEGAQELALPAGPDPGTDRLDVGDREHEQQLQPLHGLHHAGEGLDRLRVGEVAALGDGRHQEMMLDEPGRGLGFGRIEAEPRPEPARDAGAGDRMVLGAALGDVVQEQRDVESPPVLDRAHDAVRERVLVLDPLAVDLGEHADRAQEMLVDRVVVVHVELHHRDDAAEIGDEAPEHAGLVHQPQHHLRRVARGQDVHEQAVRLGVVAERRADEPKRARREPARIRVDGEVVPVGEPEQADQVHRIALERALARKVDAVVVDDEVVGFEPAAAAAPEAPDHAVEHRPVLRLACLELGADDRGEVADLLRDAKIRLHEALDPGERAAPGLAHALGELALQLEAETLLGPAGREMHVAADPPQEFLAALEEPELFRA